MFAYAGNRIAVCRPGIRIVRVDARVAVVSVAVIHFVHQKAAARIFVYRIGAFKVDVA